MCTTNLETEYRTYQRNLPLLLAQTGKHVLIKGRRVIETFDTHDDAVKYGYAIFKLKPFLVKQIGPVDMPRFFSRNIFTMSAPEQVG